MTQQDHQHSAEQTARAIVDQLEQLTRSGQVKWTYARSNMSNAYMVKARYKGMRLRLKIGTDGYTFSSLFIKRWNGMQSIYGGGYVSTYGVSKAAEAQIDAREAPARAAQKAREDSRDNRRKQREQRRKDAVLSRLKPSN